MVSQIRFRSIVYDTLALSSKVQSHTLFKDEPLININPVNQKTEQEIVQWLFGLSNFVEIILDEIGQRNIIRPFIGILRSEFQLSPEKDGDFDVVFCPYGKPHELTCIEFKRIKVDQMEYSGDTKINGLGRLDKLVHQGNIARGTGFHKTYIAALALINTSKFVRPNIMTKFDGTSEYKCLYEIHNFGNLDSQIGALLVEVEQPTGQDFKKNGMINVAQLRPSTRQEQSSRVTEDFNRIYLEKKIGRN